MSKKFTIKGDPPKRLSDIGSSTAREVLKRVDRDQGVVPKEIGKEKGLIDPGIIEQLEQAGLIHKTMNRKRREIWRPTALGRSLVRQHVPTLLPRRGWGGYVAHPSQAMLGEPEAIEWEAA